MCSIAVYYIKVSGIPSDNKLISSHVKISFFRKMIFLRFITTVKFVGACSKHLRIFFGRLWPSSVIFGKCLEIFSLRNVRKRSSGLRTNFGKSSKIFGKWSKIFGKSPQTSLCIVKILCNEKKITWSLGDTKFIFSCFEIFHSFAALKIKINFVSSRGHVISSIYFSPRGHGNESSNLIGS